MRIHTIQTQRLLPPTYHARFLSENHDAFFGRPQGFPAALARARLTSPVTASRWSGFTHSRSKHVWSISNPSGTSPFHSRCATLCALAATKTCPYGLPRLPRRRPRRSSESPTSIFQRLYLRQKLLKLLFEPIACHVSLFAQQNFYTIWPSLRNHPPLFSARSRQFRHNWVLLAS